MKRGLIIGIIIVSVIILGFTIGTVLPETNAACTEIGCPCEGVSGERSCNSCFFSDHIFTTGIINIVQECRASEIIICENNAQVGSRIDLANKGCRTDWYVFGFNLRYLGTNPEEPAVSVSSSAPLFPTQNEPAAAFNEALLSGTLEELGSCLRVNGNLIVWPYGFSLNIVGGVIQVVDDAGQPVAHVGDKVRFSGSGLSEDGIEDRVDIVDILGKLSAELPSDRCSGPYWAVGEIMEITE